MASWYSLRNEWGMITSHEPVHLMLASAIRQIQGSAMNIDINSFSFCDTKITTPLTEYLLKPQELNGECWYDYLENYIMKHKSIAKKSEYYELHSNHPKSKSHVIVKRNDNGDKNGNLKFAVVQYHGFSLKPTIRRDTEEKREIFSMCVLVMFKSYTCISDIKGNYKTYRDALYDNAGNMRAGVLNSIGYKVVSQNEDRWKSKFSSEKEAKNHRIDMEKAAKNITVEHDNEGNISHIITDEDVCEEIVHGDMEIYTQNFHEVMIDDTKDMEIDADCDNLLCNKIQSQLNTIYDPELDETRIDEGYKSKIFLSSRRCAYMERLHYQRAVEVRELIDAAINSLLPGADSSLFTEIRNKYEIPQNEYVEYDISEEKGKIKFSICSSLQEIVDVFTFSKDQKRAFVIGAIPLLKNIGEDETDESSYLQVFGVVQGLAGSGKSYVIKAWNVLALSWGQEYAVQCVCLTGIAASYINGRTIHSLLNATETQIQCIKVLVIDEVFILSLPYIYFYSSNFFSYRFIWCLVDY